MFRRKTRATSTARTVWRKKNGVRPMKTPTARPMARCDGSSSRWSTPVTCSRNRRQERTTNSRGRPLRRRLALGGRLRDRDRDGDLLAVAEEAQAEALADRGVQDQALEVLQVLDRDVTDLDDHVVRLQARLLGGSPRQDPGHDGALLDGCAEALGQFLGERLEGDPQPAPDDLALRDQRGGDALGHVDRDGEADALPGGHDGGVDPD